MKVTVWNENLHEKDIPLVTELYPGGLHGYIAGFLKDADVEVRTATLDDPQCGLTEDVLADTDVLVWWGHVAHDRVPDEVVDRVQRHVLADTDVLVWWGHVAHDRVPDEVVDRVQRHVLSGMGLVVLHSGHHSRIFRRLLGTTCNLKWRDDARERLWTVKPNHPIAAGVPETFVLDREEMYGEPFDIAEPQETVFMGWFNGGEVFRSGCTWVRGNGKVFYFQPGHETNKGFQNEHVQRIIKNAVRWACPIRRVELACPHFEALEG